MSIRQEIAALIDAAARAAQAAGEIPPVVLLEPLVERPARPEHGDYATSLPLRLSRAARQSPMSLAEAIVRHLPENAAVGEVTVAAPGFINVRLADAWLARQVDVILEAGPGFAHSDAGGGRRLQVEFVSANPTGPLHVGNGRWASIGDSLARVLAAAGWAVEKEYLVNDQFTQVDTFALTLLARYKQLFGIDVDIPAEGYPGEYVIDLAKEAKAAFGDRFLRDEQPAPALRRWGVDRMVALIRDDLAAMNVGYDVWFYESALYGENGTYEESMALLRRQGAVVEKEGAVWFASSALGEERDNVLIRSTGVPTYFASDIAYHYDKFFKRGFERVIDIWGADHQGHVSRVKTAVAALGVEEGRLAIIIGQLVGLKRGGEVVRASKRAGEIITLREVVDEVGADACRFFFLQRSADAQMEFDLDLAKRQSNENPVYYVQYAHARAAGILTTAAERGVAYEDGAVALLREPAELALVRRMLLLPELVESVAESYEPHHLPHYALDLATAFHDFYEKCRVIGDDAALSKARLRLSAAAKVVLGRTLDLMGMSAPERM
ncbi:MAG TPA: arginine--tRNA ligase [Dehalococcoidia bacterium]